MAVFENYPYTNLHNLNLDYIMKHIKTALEGVDANGKSIVELREYVDNYFDSLDVDERILEEVRTQIRALIDAGEFDAIIEQYLSGEIDVIFPRLLAEGSDTLGDCTIIKSANKVMMIDCYLDAASWQGVRNALTRYGITKIDYFILTHYHIDHYGNIPRLLADYDCSQTEFIIPNLPTMNPNIDMSANYNTVLGYLTGYNYTFANNNSFMFDGVTVNLYNSSVADWNAVTALGTNDYNNYSIVTEVLFKGHKIALLADIQQEAQEVIHKAGYLKANYDLVKDAHHGYAGVYAPFAYRVNPNYLVVPVSHGMLRGITRIANGMELTMYFASLGSKVYFLCYQNDDICYSITVNGLTMQTMNEVSPMTLFMSGWSGVTLTVDDTTAGVYRNGTPDYPFKDITEAVMFANKFVNGVVNISVVHADTDRRVYIEYTGAATLVINGNGNNIGQTNVNKVLTHITFNNCSFITAESGRAPMMVSNCNKVIFNACKFTGNNSACVIVGDSSVEYDNSVEFINASGVITSYQRSQMIMTIDQNPAQVIMTNCGNNYFFNGSYNSIRIHQFAAAKIQAERAMCSAYNKTVQSWLENFTVRTS